MIKIIYEICGDEEAVFASKLSGYKLSGDMISLFNNSGKLFYKGQFLQNSYNLEQILDNALDDSKIVKVNGDLRFFKD